MDKTIDVFGDSHTYGGGLDDCGHEKPWEQYSRSAWPYHMFNEKQIRNFSWSGCSNDTICLKLIRNTSKKNTVLIMFTYPERIHITRNGYNFIVGPNFCGSVSDNGDENWIAKQLAERDEKRNQKFLVENFDDNFLEILFLKNILWCQYFCESNGIEYYFTMVKHREKTKMKGSLEKYRDSLYDNINWHKMFLIQGKYGFCDYAEKINAEKGNDDSHYGLKYHKLFGELFLDWINKEKVL